MSGAKLSLQTNRTIILYNNEYDENDTDDTDDTDDNNLGEEGNKDDLSKDYLLPFRSRNSSLCFLLSDQTR